MSSWAKGTIWIWPAGTPASCRTSARSSAVSGVFIAGLSSIVFPVAMQGATLWATRLRGKLKGVIPRITPSGKRRTIPKWPSPGALASILMPWPSSASASAAANRKVRHARSTSASAKVTGFPASATMTSTNSRRRSRRSWLILSSVAARASLESLRVFWNAECALAMADSISCEPAVQISASFSPDQGLWTASEVCVSTQHPSR